MTTLDLPPRNVCLLREEYVSRFKLGHNIGVPSDLLMVEAFPTDHLTHLNIIGLRALEADNGIPLRHIALQLIGLFASLHSSSLPFTESSWMYPIARTSCNGGHSTGLEIPSVVPIVVLERP
jgi:hypothetical protein